MPRRLLITLPLALALLSVPGAIAGGTARTESLGSSPQLTRDVPRFVTQICNSGRAKSPLPLVCPPVVPVSKYRRYAGSSGVLLGDTNIPPVKPPADDIYLVEFNGGDAGPTYWHWIAGMGTPQAIHYWVLSDAHNEVKGKANRVKTLVLEGRLVEIWRFPDYPAGGQFGGHFAAITRSGPYLAIASIHGYNSAVASARMVVALARTADAAR
jgi:hypothetical protein